MDTTIWGLGGGDARPLVRLLVPIVLIKHLKGQAFATPILA